MKVAFTVFGLVAVGQTARIPHRRASPPLTPSSSNDTSDSTGGESRAFSRSASISTQISSTSSRAATATTTGTAQPTYTWAANITIGPEPSICTAPQYHWQIDSPITPGYIAIHAGLPGWGELGSIWNISTGEGATLTQMAVKCSKTQCPYSAAAIGSKAIPLSQRSDGSWYMNVTTYMTSDVIIQGLLEQSGTSGNQPSNSDGSHNSTYPLHISGFPNCGTPVAQNCTNSNFTFAPTQWDAYGVNGFMSKYVSDRGINSFQTLLQQAQNDFEPKTKVQNNICEISSQQFNCPGPDYTMCQATSENTTTVSGAIMTKGVTNFATFLNLIYMALDQVSGNIGDWIDGAVTAYWNPAEKADWSRIVNIANAVLAIAATAAFEFGFIVTAASKAAVHLANGLGTHGFMAVALVSLGLKIPDPKPEETMFKQASGYKVGAQNYIKQVQSGFEALFASPITSSDLVNVFGGGTWVADDIYTAFTTTGNAKRVAEWYEKQMVAQFVSRALIDNDFYIVFVPYGDKQRYTDKEIGFSDDDCIHHWINNPNWRYASVCGMTFGPDGPKGMALFVRPGDEGSDTTALIKQKLNYHGRDINFTDILGSSLWGHQKYGFNYTLLDKEAEFVTANGLADATTSFTQQDLAFDYPGLFNLPVCVLSDLTTVPGVGQVLHDMGKLNFPVEIKNPCECSGYSYQAPGSQQSLKFMDVVTDKVKKSIESNKIGCKAQYKS